MHGVVVSSPQVSWLKCLCLDWDPKSEIEYLGTSVSKRAALYPYCWQLFFLLFLRFIEIIKLPSLLQNRCSVQREPPTSSKMRNMLPSQGYRMAIPGNGATVERWVPPHDATAPSGPGPPHYRGFTITLRHTILSRTPLDEWSARRRDLYLTTHSTTETSMSLAEFELTISAGERPQTDALYRDATGIGRMAMNYWRIEETHKPAAMSVTFLAHVST
jgi:hypothetical protein